MLELVSIELALFPGGLQGHRKQETIVSSIFFNEETVRVKWVN